MCQEGCRAKLYERLGPYHESSGAVFFFSNEVCILSVCLIFRSVIRVLSSVIT